MYEAKATMEDKPTGMIITKMIILNFKRSFFKVYSSNLFSIINLHFN